MLGYHVGVGDQEIVTGAGGEVRGGGKKTTVLKLVGQRPTYLITPSSIASHCSIIHCLMGFEVDEIRWMICDSAGLKKGKEQNCKPRSEANNNKAIHTRWFRFYIIRLPIIVKIDIIGGLE